MAKKSKRKRPATHPFHLKAWRKALGYTQEQMAEAVGISGGRYADLENRNERWNEDFLWDCAQTLNIPVNKLLTEAPGTDADLVAEAHKILEALTARGRKRALRILRAELAEETEVA